MPKILPHFFTLVIKLEQNARKTRIILRYWDLTTKRKITYCALLVQNLTSGYCCKLYFNDPFINFNFDFLPRFFMRKDWTHTFYFLILKYVLPKKNIKIMEKFNCEILVYLCTLKYLEFSPKNTEMLCKKRIM